jgi:hypothetical protein
MAPPVDAQIAGQHLEELASRYRITYRILPELGLDARGHTQKIGFDLELYAVAGAESAVKERPPASPETLQAPNGALREVAEWALASEQQGVCVSVDAPTDRVLYEPKMNAWVVQLAAHVLHCDGVSRPLAESQQHFLDEVRRRLASIGLHEV